MANENDSLITRQQLQEDLLKLYNKEIKPYLNSSSAEINDSTISSSLTWSSNKIKSKLDEYANSSDNYSTTEKAVATWIDGKTVYEKVITCTMPTTTSKVVSTSYTDIGVSVDSVISCDVFDIASSNNISLINPTYVLVSDWVSFMRVLVYANSTSSHANTIALTTNHQNWSGSTVKVILRYTKV